MKRHKIEGVQDENRLYYEKGFLAAVVVDALGNIYQGGKRLPVHVCKGGNGYCYTNVKCKRNDGSVYGKTYSVHKLVAKAWLGQTAEEVDHIDRNPRNNKPANLRWVSHAENQHRLGTRRAISRGVMKAWQRRNGQTRYQNGIFTVGQDGMEHAQHFDTVAQASAYTGVSTQTIYRILNNQYGFRSAKGYTFVADAVYTPEEINNTTILKPDCVA